MTATNSDSTHEPEVGALAPLFPDLRVLEWAQGGSAPYAGRLLADLGADVVKLEPPSGDRARVPRTPDRSFSGLFEHVNAGKRSVAIDWTTSAGQEFAAAALRWANCVILDGSSPAAESGELLDNVAADAVVVVITPYGVKGGLGGIELGARGLFHAGGEGYQTPRGAGQTVPPVAPSANIALFDSGVAGAYAVLLFLVSRLSQRKGEPGTGEPALFDIASREVQMSLGRQDLAAYPNEGRIEDRTVEPGPLLSFDLHSLGGLIIANVFHHAWADWCHLVGRPELIDDIRFATKEARLESQDAIAVELEKWTRDYRKSEVEEAAQTQGLPVAAVLSPLEVLDDDQLRFRKFFAECVGGDGGRATVAAALPFVTQDRERWLPQRLAPALGEHTASFCAELGYTNAEVDDLLSDRSPL